MNLRHYFPCRDGCTAAFLTRRQRERHEGRHMTATTLDRITAEEQAIHHNQPFDLRELAVEVMRRGLMGATILVNTGDRGLPYAACFLNHSGHAVDHTYSQYTTPEAAFESLLAQSRAK